MKQYLLDTSVLSLLAPGRAGIPAPLTDWFRAHADRLFLSTITIAKIQQGIASCADRVRSNAPRFSPPGCMT